MKEIANNSDYTYISAEHKFASLKLKEVFKYRQLIWLFTKRGFQVSYKQTILGPLWLFINPLLTSIVYVVLFGNIAKISTGGVPQLLFYLSGNAMWTYFSTCLSSNSTIFLSNSGLFGKIYFPRLVVPFSTMLSAILKFGIQMILVAVLLVFYIFTGAVHPHYLFWLTIPLILIVLGLMGTGLGLVISSFTTKYRDLTVLVSFGMSIWMYATPVVYPLSVVPQGWIHRLVMLNPVTSSMELFRYGLVGYGEIPVFNLILSLAVTAIVMIVGIMIFNKIERNFLDTV